MNIKDGKVYNKNSNYSGDIIMNIKDAKVYDGNSNYSGDILFTMDGLASIEEFVAVYYVFKYVY